MKKKMHSYLLSLLEDEFMTHYFLRSQKSRKHFKTRGVAYTVKFSKAGISSNPKTSEMFGFRTMVLILC